MKTTKPSSQVYSNALFRPLALAAKARLNASTAPAPINSAIKLPISPQTIMTQAMVSSIITVNKVEEKLVSAADGSSNTNPRIVPTSSDTIGRLLNIAMTTVASAGSSTGQLPSITLNPHRLGWSASIDCRLIGAPSSTYRAADSHASLFASQNTALLRSVVISSSDKPNSANTSSVCSPNNGGILR